MVLFASLSGFGFHVLLSWWMVVFLGSWVSGWVCSALCSVGLSYVLSSLVYWLGFGDRWVLAIECGFRLIMILVFGCWLTAADV